MQLGSIHVATVDLVAVAVLVIFLVRGILKGFVSQMALVVTVVGGLLVAKWLSPQIQPAIKRWLGGKVNESTQLEVYISYFIIFLVFVLVIGIVARVLQNSVNKLNLHSFNRSMGAVAGLVLGACIIVVAVLGVSHMGWAEADRALHGSYTARLSYHAVEALTPLFPEKIQERMSAYLKPLEGEAGEGAAQAKSQEPTTPPPTRSHK